MAVRCFCLFDGQVYRRNILFNGFHSRRTVVAFQQRPLAMNPSLDRVVMVLTLCVLRTDFGLGDSLLNDCFHHHLARYRTVYHSTMKPCLSD